MPREYVINVVYTCIGEEFKTWIKKLIRERNEAAIEKKDQLIEMDPVVAHALQQATHKSFKFCSFWHDPNQPFPFCIFLQNPKVSHIL